MRKYTRKIVGGDHSSYRVSIPKLIAEDLDVRKGMISEVQKLENNEGFKVTFPARQKNNE